MCETNISPKPPLGVTPKYIHDIQRIQELCRALHEYSQFDVINDLNYDIMIKWSQELFEIIKSKHIEKSKDNNIDFTHSELITISNKRKGI